jgi:hypothetical protein
MHASAMLGTDGSIHWLCLPHLAQANFELHEGQSIVLALRQEKTGAAAGERKFTAPLCC